MNNFNEELILNLKTNIENQENLKNVCFEYLQKITDILDNVNPDYADNYLELLKTLNDILNLINTNIETYNNLLNNFKNILKNDNIKIENFYSDNLSTTSNSSTNTELPADYHENTLIISEKKGKIFLPYKLENLEQLLNSKNNNYSNYNEILKENYIVQYQNFSNFAFSRFREAFNLVKNKEKHSFLEALDLGIELMFNSNLHPAIITACKNIDELDIYLDCLKNNEIDQFTCFNIIFDMAPITSKIDKETQA